MSESLWSITGSPVEQERAAREGAALFDLSQREHIELTGRDRATFLHNFCTQEIRKLPAGRGAEAFVTNIKGRIVSHVLVFAGEDVLWLDLPQGGAARLVPHLDRYLITEDVQIRDRTPDWGELGLIGPVAAAIVAGLVPGSGQYAQGQHAHANGITVRRWDFTRLPGWLIGCERSRLPALAEQLQRAGARAAAGDVFEALRIEAVFPAYGVDLSEDHLAHEAGRTRQAISFTKGCYLGQEPIARLESLGHTNRELRGLRIENGTATIGARVRLVASGAEVGTVTSSARLPHSNCGVAMAMLKREACVPGTAVDVESPQGVHRAIVTVA